MCLLFETMNNVLIGSSSLWKSFQMQGDPDACKSEMELYSRRLNCNECLQLGARGKKANAEGK